jgi:hypothetical protein
MVFQLEKGPERIQLFFTSPSPYALFKNLPEEERKNSILTRVPLRPSLLIERVTNTAQIRSQIPHSHSVQDYRNITQTIENNHRWYSSLDTPRTSLRPAPGMTSIRSGAVSACPLRTFEHSVCEAVW